MIRALTLIAFLKRVTLEFVVPCLQGIGVNMFHHVHLFPQRAFCMKRGRSGNQGTQTFEEPVYVGQFRIE